LKQLIIILSRLKNCGTGPFIRICVKNAMTGLKKRQKSVYQRGISDFISLLKWKMTFKQTGVGMVIGLISGTILGLFLNGYRD
jgi:hypothetical protein